MSKRRKKKSSVQAVISAALEIALENTRIIESFVSRYEEEEQPKTEPSSSPAQMAVTQ